MANRFGRNQKRRLLAHIAHLEDGLTMGAVHAVREVAREGLGFNATFVDDDMKIIVGLAQRAVLAGLASDCHPPTLARFQAASEKWRDGHEKALGRPIAPCSA